MKALLPLLIAATAAAAEPDLPELPPLPDSPDKAGANEPALIDATKLEAPILPAPESLAAAAGRPTNAGARTALNDAAAKLRKMAARFRSKECTRAELLAASAEVRRAAAAYRASLR